MGIHNEPGTSKLSLPKASELVSSMLSKIIDTTDKDRSFVPFKSDGSDEVVLLVNDLGAISELEMTGIATEGECKYLPSSSSLITAVQFLSSKKIKVRRILTGTYMTSLSMPGFSLSLLLLPGSGEPYSSSEILKLIDAPANAPGWKWTSGKEPGVLSEKAETAAAKKGKEVDLARESSRPTG